MDILNIYVSLLGWLAYNVFMFSMAKDKYDNSNTKFPLRQYVAKVWDNWLASFIVVPILLWVGYRQLDIISNPLDEHAARIAWNDLYYLASGFATEFIMNLIKKIVKS